MKDTDGKTNHVSGDGSISDAMAGTMSPSHFNGSSEGGSYLYGSSPPEDISLRMRVPKRITANGEISDDDLHGGHNGYNWEMNDKFDMNVPDRIMLMGQDQHLGTRAPPREIVLENSVLGSTFTFGDVRINTPPRVITLGEHCFPSAAELPVPGSPTATPSTPIAERKVMPLMGTTPPSRFQSGFDDSRILYREVTPPVEGLSTSEEVVHLRRQVARLNRRVMAIEVDTLQRQQKERIMYAFGVAYIIYKMIAWLNRS